MNVTTPPTTGTDISRMVEAVRIAARARVLANRNSAVRAAVDAGADLDAISTAARLTRARIRQITKAEHTRDLARRYGNGLRTALSRLIADIDNAEQAATAATTTVDGMTVVDEICSERDRGDLLDDLSDIRHRLRDLRRVGDYFLGLADVDRAVDWLIPTSGDTPMDNTPRRDRIVRALPAWHRKHGYLPDPKTWTSHDRIRRDVSRPLAESPPSTDPRDDAVSALARDVGACREQVADLTRSTVLIASDVSRVNRFDLGFGIEPNDDEHVSLIGDSRRLEEAAHNLWRVIDGYQLRHHQQQHHARKARTS